MTLLRKLVWVYLLLLLLEGAVRKWLVPPALSAPLLLVREPVIFLIYFYALRQGLSFRGFLNSANLFLAVTTTITATLFGIANGLVTIYGVLADYVQIPLLLLMPQILTRDDVLKMGKVLLYFVPPMALLTVLQFLSSPESIWNRGAMTTHFETVRPSGTFSFSNGIAYYYALAAAFIFYGYLQPRTYKIWLLALATGFTLTAAAMSGSRACLVSVALVAAVAVLCVVMKGRGAVGILVAAALTGVAILVLSSVPVVKHGTDQMFARFQEASDYEGGAKGFSERYFGTFLSAFIVMPDTPVMGFGLGTGTNGAAALFDEPVDLFWPENEWGRLVFECGWIFGLLLCIFRTALTIYIARAAYQAFRRDELLPALLFAATGLLVLNGQWGGPTPLGFAIFGGGLTLAACHDPEAEEWYEDEDGEEALEHESVGHSAGHHRA